MTEELNLKEVFANFVNFILRNNKLILGIVLTGVISVVLFQKLKKPYYETKAICKSGISEYERVEYEEDWLQRTAIDVIIIAVAHNLFKNYTTSDFKQISSRNLVLLDIKGLYNNSTWKL